MKNTIKGLNAHLLSDYENFKKEGKTKGLANLDYLDTIKLYFKGEEMKFEENVLYDVAKYSRAHKLIINGEVYDSVSEFKEAYGYAPSKYEGEVIRFNLPTDACVNEVIDIMIIKMNKYYNENEITVDESKSLEELILFNNECKANIRAMKLKLNTIDVEDFKDEKQALMDAIESVEFTSDSVEKVLYYKKY